MDNRPFSEQFLTAGEDWASKEAAASLLEDSKSAVMAQRQSMLGDMPINRAEQIVKASPDWTSYIEQTIEARRVANVAKVQMEYLRMKFSEHQSHEANARTEAKLLT